MTKLSERITVKVGDITREEVCAVVNAANSSLMGGGGVDGAIHRAGGHQIAEACQALRQSRFPDGLPTGEAVATPAGTLPASYVIHTVGPIYAACGERCAALLGNCYRNSLKEASLLGCRSVAFPAISTGIYGYPKDEAAVIAFETVTKAVETSDLEVTFVFHSIDDYNSFLNAVQRSSR